MPPLDLVQLGKRIRQARERSGLSQAELGAAILKDQTALSEIEGGKRKLLITDLPLLTQKLGVSIAYLFGEETILTDLDQLALHTFRDIPDFAKHEAIQVLRSLAKIAKTDPD